MRIEVHGRNLTLGDDMKEHARRRVEQALDRWADRIVAVVVDVSDANGPRGGADKTVRVRADVEGPGEVVAEDVAADVAAAIDLATTRLKAGVSRFLQRRSREEKRRQ
jgi:ribosomal subunit interface protein